MLTISDHAAEKMAREALASQDNEWSEIPHPRYACGVTMASKSKLILRELDHNCGKRMVCTACKRVGATRSEEHGRQRRFWDALKGRATKRRERREEERANPMPGGSEIRG